MLNTGTDSTTTVETTTTKPETTAPEAKTFDESYVQKLRQEAAGYRTKLKELETGLEQKQSDFQANLLKALGLDPDPSKQAESQIAEARTKAQAAETRANERLIKAEIKSISAELGLVDADAAYALMDKAGLAIDDDGTVTGAKEALDALILAKPWLKKAEAAVIGGGANPPGGGNKASTAQEEYDSVKAMLQAKPGDHSLMQKLFLLKEKLMEK